MPKFTTAYTTWWARKKTRLQKLLAIILSNVNQFTVFFTGRLLGKFLDNWLLEIPAFLAYVATLPRETLMSEDKRLTINCKNV